MSVRVRIQVSDRTGILILSQCVRGGGMAVIGIWEFENRFVAFHFTVKIVMAGRGAGLKVSVLPSLSSFFYGLLESGMLRNGIVEERGCKKILFVERSLIWSANKERDGRDLSK